MLSRSVPFQGGIDAAGSALPAGVDSGTGESVAPTASSGVAEDDAAAPDTPGDGVASAAQSLVVSLPMKMQPLSRTERASMSYRATTTWLAAITRSTARSPAIESGLRANRRPPVAGVAPGWCAFMYSATRYASMIATRR